MVKLSFSLQERLKGKKRIAALFKQGSAFNVYPFQVRCQVNSSAAPSHQVLFAVPSRYFKRAVDRNKMKRRAREAYRLQKNQLGETPVLLIGFIYTASEMLPYGKIHQAIGQAIQKLNKRQLPS